MARIRSVKPELRTSLVVASWSRDVRYFWVLLWGYLDDHGRGVDDARLVKADCLPLDDDVTPVTVDSWMNVIASAGPLCRYEVGGRRYVHAVNWPEHQKPQHPKNSVHPQCPLNHAFGPLHEDFMRTSGSPPTNFIPEQVVGAGSREQGGTHAAAPEKSSTGAAEAIVSEMTGATPDEARAIADRIRTERKPKSLPGLVRVMGRDGDLRQFLTDLRAAARKADVATALARAREGPKCEHGVAGGESPHPTGGKAICPQCRSRAGLHALNGTARPAPSWNAPTGVIRAVVPMPVEAQETP